MRVQQNGDFYSLAIFIEQPDERYLKRQGLDPEGALYKMFNTLDKANLREEVPHDANPDLYPGAETCTLCNQAKGGVGREELAASYWNIGNVHSDIFNYPESNEWYRKAARIYEELNLQTDLIQVNYNIGLNLKLTESRWRDDCC